MTSFGQFLLGLFDSLNGDLGANVTFPVHVTGRTAVSA